MPVGDTIGKSDDPSTKSEPSSRTRHAVRLLWSGVCALCRGGRAVSNVVVSCASFINTAYKVYVAVGIVLTVLALFGITRGDDLNRWAEERLAAWTEAPKQEQAAPNIDSNTPRLAPLVLCISEPLSTFAEIITKDPAKFADYKGRPLCDTWKPLFIQRVVLTDTGGWRVWAGRSSLPSLEIEMYVRADASSLKPGNRVRVAGTPSQFERGKLKLSDPKIWPDQ
jgi:hypothetical protein